MCGRKIKIISPESNDCPLVDVDERHGGSEHGLRDGVMLDLLDLLMLTVLCIRTSD